MSIAVCCRSLVSDALPPADTKLDAYRIKRSYQLIGVLGLQLAVIIARLVAIIKIDLSDLPDKTIALINGIVYSMFALAVLDWVLLFASYVRRNDVYVTCRISIVALVVGFVLKFAYLFIPYRELIDLSDDTELKTFLEHSLQLLIFLLVVLPIYIPNLMLLRSCKQAACYLAEYYETEEKFFYVLSIILTSVYMLIVTIAYGVLFFCAQYVIADYANYVPVAWALWFVGSILEVYSVRRGRIMYEGIGICMVSVWWILVFIALVKLDMIETIVAVFVSGWVQYLQLKLQLRDLFVMLDCYRKENNQGGNSVELGYATVDV